MIEIRPSDKVRIIRDDGTSVDTTGDAIARGLRLAHTAIFACKGDHDKWRAVARVANAVADAVREATNER